jgi:hypothetical protein
VFHNLFEKKILIYNVSFVLLHHSQEYSRKVVHFEEIY